MGRFVSETSTWQRSNSVKYQYARLEVRILCDPTFFLRQKKANKLPCAKLNEPSLEIHAQVSRAINLTRKHTWCILFFTIDKSMFLITHFFIFLNLFHSQLPVNFKRSIPSSYSSFFFVYFSAKTWHTSKAKFKWKFRTLLFVPFFLPVNNSNLPKLRRCNNKLWKFILEFLQTPFEFQISYFTYCHVCSWGGGVN